MLYFLIFLFSFFLTYIIKNYAIKKSLVAQVNERSSHTVPTPHGGGIAIAITWFVGVFFLYCNNQIDSKLFYALLIGIIISFVSFFDDLFELSAKLRLLIQSGVAFGGLFVLGGLKSIDLGIFIIDNEIITNIFAFFVIVWFINLYNFLDGIDGYAGSESIFLSIAGFLLFGGNHFLVLIASVSGFLILNWHKAKIFMGDVGSTLLGYNVAIFTIYYANYESQNLWIWIILFGVFWFDAILTLFRRYINGEKLSQAHKKHAYQRLTQSGYPHSIVVSFSIVINVILFIFVYYISNVFIAFIFSLVLLYSALKFVDRRKAFL